MLQSVTHTAISSNLDYSGYRGSGPILDAAVDLVKRGVNTANYFIKKYTGFNRFENSPGSRGRGKTFSGGRFQMSLGRPISGERYKRWMPRPLNGGWEILTDRINNLPYGDFDEAKNTLIQIGREYYNMLDTNMRNILTRFKDRRLRIYPNDEFLAFVGLVVVLDYYRLSPRIQDTDFRDQYRYILDRFVSNDDAKYVFYSLKKILHNPNNYSQDSIQRRHLDDLAKQTLNPNVPYSYTLFNTLPRIRNKSFDRDAPQLPVISPDMSDFPDIPHSAAPYSPIPPPPAAAAAAAAAPYPPFTPSADNGYDDSFSLLGSPFNNDDM